MTRERFIELQTEIARLRELDKKTSDRIDKNYSRLLVSLSKTNIKKTF